MPVAEWDATCPILLVAASSLVPPTHLHGADPDRRLDAQPPVGIVASGQLPRLELVSGTNVGTFAGWPTDVRAWLCP